MRPVIRCDPCMAPMYELHHRRYTVPNVVLVEGTRPLLDDRPCHASCSLMDGVSRRYSYLGRRCHPCRFRARVSFLVVCWAAT
jgi:hypothetical protein